MRKEWLIPVTIVIAGALIAVAVYVVHYHAVVQVSGDPNAVRPVTPSDHMLGDPAAVVTIIEYADIDAEYSKDFQQVMNQVIENYGQTGNVAWVYRHLPAAGVDVHAESHAEAAECVGALSGTNNFFKFINALQTAAPGENQFDPAGYDAVVQSLGVSTGDFDTCMANHTYKNRIQADYQNAGEIGATGSPFSILLIKGKAPSVISGSIPYSTMKQIIDAAITKALAH